MSHDVKLEMILSTMLKIKVNKSPFLLQIKSKCETLKQINIIFYCVEQNIRYQKA